MTQARWEVDRHTRSAREGEGMKEVNKDAFEAIEKGQPCTFEKLVALVIRPTANNYAELFKDLACGIAATTFAAAILIEVLK